MQSIKGIKSMTYYHRLDTLKIERWSRRLSWYYLVSIPLSILFSAINLYRLFSSPEYVDLLSPIDSPWVKWHFTAEFIMAVLYPVVPFLLLQGVSKAIRYLLAMRSEMDA